MRADSCLNDYAGRWWLPLPDGRVACQLCPRGCKLRAGQRGFCFIRRRSDGGITLDLAGRVSGLCDDPIEKKPLFHFLPGSRALSFGTAGCNLGCRFCQNWGMSRAGEADRSGTGSVLPPAAVAAAAVRSGCRSVAFTYNDPVVFAEYAIDTACACRSLGIRTIAVTAGYIAADARAEFFGAMDAANVDLKAFNDDFYRRFCAARLQPVLDTLVYLQRETNVWLEVTTLLIPGMNDGADEIERASDWFAGELGPDVPWHFSAFHPDYQMTDVPPASLETLVRAREIARGKGLRYVYMGNVRSHDGESTWCPACGVLLIERDRFSVGACNLEGSCCRACGCRIAGCFE